MLKKRNLFKEEVADDIWLGMHQRNINISGLIKVLKTGWIDWNKNDQTLEFLIDLDADFIANINSDEALRKVLSKSFKEHYSYDGPSRFGINDIPF